MGGRCPTRVPSANGREQASLLRGRRRQARRTCTGCRPRDGRCLPHRVGPQRSPRSRARSCARRSCSRRGPEGGCPSSPSRRNRPASRRAPGVPAHRPRPAHTTSRRSPAPQRCPAPPRTADPMSDPFPTDGSLRSARAPAVSSLAGGQVSPPHELKSTQ